MVPDLAEYLRGWIGYFGRCGTPSVLAELGAMAPTSTSVDGLETVETRAPQARHRCAGSRINRRQLRWTVAPRKHSRAKTRSVEPLLRLARPSRDHGSWLVQPAEPPEADPHVRSCGRGGQVTVSPIPILSSANSAKPIMHARTGIGQEPGAIRRIAANRNTLENRKRTGFL